MYLRKKYLVATALVLLVLLPIPIYICFWGKCAWAVPPLAIISGHILPSIFFPPFAGLVSILLLYLFLFFGIKKLLYKISNVSTPEGKPTVKGWFTIVFTILIIVAVTHIPFSIQYLRVKSFNDFLKDPNLRQCTNEESRTMNTITPCRVEDGVVLVPGNPEDHDDQSIFMPYMPIGIE